MQMEFHALDRSVIFPSPDPNLIDGIAIAGQVRIDGILPRFVLDDVMHAQGRALVKELGQFVSLILGQVRNLDRDGGTAVVQVKCDRYRIVILPGLAGNGLHHSQDDQIPGRVLQ